MRLLALLAHRVRRGVIGEPLALPAGVLARYPELAEANWRRGGVPLRVGGWCLGQRTVAGITLGKTVFLADHIRLESSLLLHELAHVRQFRQDKRFPIRYLWESIRRGYTGNRYEVEADRFVEEVEWSSTQRRRS
jgi:hypothetical protein